MNHIPIRDTKAEDPDSIVPRNLPLTRSVAESGTRQQREDEDAAAVSGGSYRKAETGAQHRGRHRGRHRRDGAASAGFQSADALRLHTNVPHIVALAVCRLPEQVIRARCEQRDGEGDWWGGLGVDTWFVCPHL